LGNTFAGRVAASLLSAVGLPELIAADPQAYYSRALQLANDRDYLAMLRAKLTANRLSSPLFDTVLFTEHLEAAFVTMWQRHEAGLAVESFAVEKR
jgi:predicted O-linked N-acetylglucosamine transferase (SPINDLY family)